MAAAGGNPSATVKRPRHVPPFVSNSDAMEHQASRRAISAVRKPGQVLAWGQPLGAAGRVPHEPDEFVGERGWQQAAHQPHLLLARALERGLEFIALVAAQVTHPLVAPTEHRGNQADGALDVVVEMLEEPRDLPCERLVLSGLYFPALQASRARPASTARPRAP